MTISPSNRNKIASSSYGFRGINLLPSHRDFIEESSPMLGKPKNSLSKAIDAEVKEQVLAKLKEHRQKRKGRSIMA